MMSFPTSAAAVNERWKLSAGWAVQLFAVGSKLTTSVVVNGVANGFPPPIAQRSPCATTLPGTFFAIGMLCSCVHVSVAML
jgi:hypothetical protein